MTERMTPVMDGVKCPLCMSWIRPYRVNWNLEPVTWVTYGGHDTSCVTLVKWPRKPDSLHTAPNGELG